MTGQEYLPDLQQEIYRSNENAFIKHLTERHIPQELGQQHKQKWFHRTMYSGKERSTSFFEDPRSLQYIHASRQNLGMIEILEEEELKWHQVYDMTDTAVTTQGQHGNLLKALTIKRQEFTDKTIQENNRGLLASASDLFRKKQPQEQQIIRYG